jgi:hypothetical protein
MVRNQLRRSLDEQLACVVIENVRGDRAGWAPRGPDVQRVVAVLQIGAHEAAAHSGPLKHDAWHAARCGAKREREHQVREPGSCR